MTRAKPVHVRVRELMRVWSYLSCFKRETLNRLIFFHAGLIGYYKGSTKFEGKIPSHFSPKTWPCHHSSDTFSVTWNNIHVFNNNFMCRSSQVTSKTKKSRRSKIAADETAVEGQGARRFWCFNSLHSAYVRCERWCAEKHDGCVTRPRNVDPNVPAELTRILSPARIVRSSVCWAWKSNRQTYTSESEEACKE